jgi:drug/metabolite transporter (DMT)-like permease
VIPATEAQLIFAFTPIFSALWASLFLHEAISAHEVAGGVGLLAVAGAVATNPKAKAPPSETRERLE